MTPEDILRIRTSRESLARLSLLYGVSKSTIANIKAGRVYKNPHICPYCKQEMKGHEDA